MAVASLAGWKIVFRVGSRGWAEGWRLTVEVNDRRWRCKLWAQVEFYRVNQMKNFWSAVIEEFSWECATSEHISVGAECKNFWVGPKFEPF